VRVRRSLLGLVALGTIAFGQTPENVLVVVNRASAVSRRIAAYYREKRHIPASNVCTLNVTEDETIPRSVYDKSIVAPLARCLKSKGLEEKILYIVTTLGLPLRMVGSAGRDGDQASVDSELTLLYQDLHGKKHPIAGPLPNPFFGRRDEPFRHPRFPMYLVCRLAAYDFEEVRGMINRSLAARNQGKVVVDLSSDNDRPGNDWLRNAAILLPASRVIFDESTKVVTGARDVIGYAGWGSNDPNVKRRFFGFHWLPGGIATEFVSTDGRTFKRPPDTWNITTWKDRGHFFAGSPQSLTADFPHEGATGASGHVWEPYLALTPRPDFLIPAYLGSRNLAESFYLSLPALSWQNIVVGDPLCKLR
jgi:uncharacterized protein (TIGR03790 family)